MNLEGYTPGAVRLAELPIEDRWILSRLATTTAAVTEALEGYALTVQERHAFVAGDLKALLLAAHLGARFSD